MFEADPPSAELDPGATDLSMEERNGAAERRDPNEPAAVVGIGASAGGIAPLQQFFEGMKADTPLESCCVITCPSLLTLNVTKVSQCAPFGEIDDGAGIE